MDDEPKPTLTSSNNNNNNGGGGRMRIKPMSLVTGAVTAQQTIREISCVGVPFYKSPGLI